jgi:sortase (surface protein transpeptidase)
MAASTLIGMSSLFFSDGAKNFSEDYKNIFVPVAENSFTGEVDSSQQETVPISTITYPRVGEQFGELIIEDCQIEDKLFFGDGNVELRNGVGIYNGSFIPGYGRTILVAGHNNTYFNGLKYAEKGQKVKIRTSYGNYIYDVRSFKGSHKYSMVTVHTMSGKLVGKVKFPFGRSPGNELQCIFHDGKQFFAGFYYTTSQAHDYASNHVKRTNTLYYLGNIYK